jgi:hypothetical protein
MKRYFFLDRPESAAHAGPGDIVVTDFFDVAERARHFGAEAVDLAELIRGNEADLDATVGAWRAALDVSQQPSLYGVPFLASLRAEILWETLLPFARFAFAARAVIPDASAVLTDAASGGPKWAGLEFALSSSGARPEPLPGSNNLSDRVLPVSHKPVVYEDLAGLSGKLLQRHAAKLVFARAVASPATQAVLDLLRPARLKARPWVVYAHYRSLGYLFRELAARFRLVLWPWGLPSAKEGALLAVGGASCARYPLLANAERIVLRSPEGWSVNKLVAAALGEIERLASAPSPERPDILPSENHSKDSGIPTDRAPDSRVAGIPSGIAGAVEPVLRKYLPPLARRLFALKHVFDRYDPRCVVVPADSSLDYAPLVLAARAKGIPAVVIAHGLEGTTVVGDKRLASHCLVWSQPMAEALHYVREGTSSEILPTGSLYLESISRKKPPRRRSVLFLSYSVRYNTAFDSWWNAERYMEAVSWVLRQLRGKLDAVAIKLHGSEDFQWYESLSRRFGLDELGVSVVQQGYVFEVLEDAGVVVGPFSTGLAEAYALGSIPFCVNFSSGKLPPPFDGSSEAPVLSTKEELAEALQDWLEYRKWTDWTPRSWPRFAAFVGEPSGAARLSAEKIAGIVRSQGQGHSGAVLPVKAGPHQGERGPYERGQN